MHTLSGRTLSGRLLPLLALAAALSLAGCGDGTAPEESIVGVYTLQTINGNLLPWIAFQDEIDHTEVLSGSITLEADGTFTDQTSYVFTIDGAAHQGQDLYTGTYTKTVAGATLTPLTPVGYAPYMVQIQGAKMSQVVQEFELVYRR
jgi:hypothetical protein